MIVLFIATTSYLCLYLFLFLDSIELNVLYFIFISFHHCVAWTKQIKQYFFSLSLTCRQIFCLSKKKKRCFSLYSLQNEHTVFNTPLCIYVYIARCTESTSNRCNRNCCFGTFSILYWVFFSFFEYVFRYVSFRVSVSLFLCCYLFVFGFCCCIQTEIRWHDIYVCIYKRKANKWEIKLNEKLNKNCMIQSSNGSYVQLLRSNHICTIRNRNTN